MASQPTAASKSSSRWGSFLANVESKLDTILADEETAAKAAATRGDGVKVQEQPAKKESMGLPAPASGSSSRTPSANRAQDRLNERLARALANKNVGKKVEEISQNASEAPSRTASPVNGTVVSPRASTEILQEKQAEEQSASQEQDQSSIARSEPVVGNKSETTITRQEANATVEPLSPVTAVQTPTIAIEQTDDSKEASRASMDSKGSVSTRPSVEITRGTTPNGPNSPTTNGSSTLPMISSEKQEKIIEQLRSDNEAAELRRQEETHDYLERIDALQAKLQYLTKEATELAKTAASEAKAGSVEQKLAKKDEQVAQLMDEGQKLSQTELKHMNIIKKLRAKATEDDKSVMEANKSVERHQKLAREAIDKARKAEMNEKLASEKIKGLPKLERELESTRAEHDANDLLVKDLQLRMAEATSAAKEAESKAHAEDLEQEKRRASDLADELSGLKVEKEMSEKSLQNEIRELKEKAERDRERQRVAEIERKAEQDSLESRLETYRARAEEASAGEGGDVQAKMLRQIETLQNQYAVASENWQGIEGSLLSRVAVLERERDDVGKREADMRRKARETNTRCRRLEEDLERHTAKLQDQDHDLASRTTQLVHLQDKLSKADFDLMTARNEFKAEQETLKAQQAARLEEERARVREELLRCPPAQQPDGFFNQSPRIGTESPYTTNTRKSSFADFIPKGSSPAQSRRRPSPSPGLIIPTPPNPTAFPAFDRRSSDKRIPTTNSSSFSDFASMNRPSHPTDSISPHPDSTTARSNNNSIPPTPTLESNHRPRSSTLDDNDNDAGYFDEVANPTTPSADPLNDLISVSTPATASAAGPSVQLVSRLSTSVRRLESEKSALKEELARLSSQRDSAREQAVELMRDARGREEVEGRVMGLEREVEEVKGRWEATLEMLGEKSERVGELEADVGDLKEILRGVVERSVG